MLTVSALAVMTRAACADSYSTPAFSPCKVTYTPLGAQQAMTTPYSVSNNGNTYGGGQTSVTQVSCTDSITAVFSWTGPSPAPQSVIVMQAASASAGDISQNYKTAGPPMAMCSDGLGDTPTITPTYPQYPPNSEQLSGSASKTVYKVQGGSTSLTLSCTPTATASVPMNRPTAGASVYYEVMVFPVTISIGGAQQDSSGNYDILVGQRCAPTVGGGPSGGSYSNVNWTVKDTANTFQSWDTSTTPPTETDGPGNLSSLSPSWYWKNKGNSPTTETISCTATYTAPDGTALSVKATQTVYVYIPDWTSSKAIAGYMQVNNKCYQAPDPTPVCLWAGPNSGGSNGMVWNLEADTPQKPIAFGSGTIEMIQIVSPNDGYVTAIAPTNHPDPNNTSTGLDGGIAYAGATASGNVAKFSTNDGPNIKLVTSTYTASSATEDTSFTDDLMYMPPGNNAQWVPLAHMGWNCSGTANIPNTNNWNDFATQNGSDHAGSVNIKPSFAASNTFPTWNTTITAKAF